jgi:hypothetical protein
MSADPCIRAARAAGQASPLLAGIALVVLSIAAALHARAQMTNAAPVAGAPPPAPAVPPVPQDYFQRYGKILSPGSEPTHPLKLNMPFPDVGQIKVPSQEEMDMRQKLEQLADLSDDDIRANLMSWPAYTKMSLGDEGAMLTRIQMFRDRRAHIAQDKARALGLLTLKPDQMARFEKEYWDKRLQLDRDLSRQFAPFLKDREAKINQELFREFSMPAHPVPPPAVAQNGKPATPPPVPPTSAAPATVTNH